MASQPSSSHAATTRLVNHLWQRLQNWFTALPPLGRVLLLLVTLFVSMSVLGLVLKFISAFIVVAVIVVALYGIVQAWATQVPTNPNNGG
ncbi:MAG: hypothetical protein F6J87_11755 [Spirulina sp. SIO3F2]|nr:hypothetical protein [Spirulina sp. SIO3F2]